MAVSRLNIRLPKNLVLLLFCLAAGFGGGWLGSEANQSDISTANSVKYVSNEGQLISKIAKDVGQSVVSVNVTQTQTARDIFGFSFPQTQTGAGTGFIIDENGTI